MLNKTEEIDHPHFCTVRNSKYKFSTKRMDKKETQLFRKKKKTTLKRKLNEGTAFVFI